MGKLLRCSLLEWCLVVVVESVFRVKIPWLFDDIFFQGSPTLELEELPSLAKALGMWKAVAEEAHAIHGEVARNRASVHDAEVCIFIFFFTRE